MAMTSTKSLGDYGEDQAAAELQKRGYEIVARQWRCQLGELDLVALHEGDLVVVEVKTRRGKDAADRALASLNAKKKAKLYALAEAYHAALEREDLGLRVDFVSVVVAPDGVFVEVYRDALAW